MNLKKLGNNDVIVISGGTNDMDNCDKASEVLIHMTKFMQSYNNTNIVIMNIPHRYNLEKNSRINLEIQKVNRKFKNISYRFGRYIIGN
jgi:lysophospholipase L1-like esterase